MMRNEGLSTTVKHKCHNIQRVFSHIERRKGEGGYTFNKTMMFETPEGEQKKQPGICWLTTLPTPNKRKLILTKKYKHTEYHHYDNYNAIEVGKVKDIPYDYNCVMGVPITIFGYDLDNVVIMGMAAGNSAVNGFGSQAGYRKHKKDRGGCPVLDDEIIYARILIRVTRRKQL